MITREEAEEELKKYFNTEGSYHDHKWSNDQLKYAYNTCRGSVVYFKNDRVNWDKLVDSFYDRYLIISSPIYKLMREEND